MLIKRVWNDRKNLSEPFRIYLALKSIAIENGGCVYKSKFTDLSTVLSLDQRSFKIHYSKLQELKWINCNNGEVYILSWKRLLDSQTPSKSVKFISEYGKDRKIFKAWLVGAIIGIGADGILRTINSRAFIKNKELNPWKAKLREFQNENLNRCYSAISIAMISNWLNVSLGYATKLKLLACEMKFLKAKHQYMDLGCNPIPQDSYRLMRKLDPTTVGKFRSMPDSKGVLTLHQVMPDEIIPNVEIGVHHLRKGSYYKNGNHKNTRKTIGMVSTSS